MRKVFVVANRHWEIREADQFGQLIFLCEIAMPKFKICEMTNSFYPKLLQSNAEDYILLSGLSVMNAIACSIFSTLHKKLNLLIHSKAKGEYEIRTVDFDALSKKYS